MKLITADELESIALRLSSKLTLNYGNLYGIKYPNFPPFSFLKMIIKEYLLNQEEGYIMIQKTDYLNPIFFREFLDKILFFNFRDHRSLVLQPKCLLIFFLNNISRCVNLKVKKTKSICLIVNKNPEICGCSKILHVSTKFDTNFNPHIIISSQEYKVSKNLQTIKRTKITHVY